MLTWEQIDGYWECLRQCMKIEPSGEKNKALIDLRNKVGASYAGRDMGHPGEQAAINIAAIHQALQTASMIAATRTAAENTKLTADTVELMRNALAETRKAQKWTTVAVIVAALAAAGTIAAALANWVAFLTPKPV
jgi:hypothetical protein